MFELIDGSGKLVGHFDTMRDAIKQMNFIETMGIATDRYSINKIEVTK